MDIPSEEQPHIAFHLAVIGAIGVSLDVSLDVSLEESARLSPLESLECLDQIHCSSRDFAVDSDLVK